MSKLTNLEIDWQKYNNLLPAIAQDYKTNEVLMLAYMNKEALELTLTSGYAHYFSRSKNRIWKKGEESGNVQIIKDVLIDCDNDTILLKVEQIGLAACHTGNRSCFFRSIMNKEDFSNPLFDPSQKYNVIDTLYHKILERSKESVDKSYTALLFNKGENHILKKIAEESGEFIIACKDDDKNAIVYEAADVIYHALVELAYKNISPDKIAMELKRRFDKSGIEEKNNRER